MDRRIQDNLRVTVVVNQHLKCWSLWLSFKDNTKREYSIEVRIKHDYSGDEPDILVVAWQEGAEIILLTEQELQAGIEAARLHSHDDIRDDNYDEADAIAREEAAESEYIQNRMSFKSFTVMAGYRVEEYVKAAMERWNAAQLLMEFHSIM